MKKINKVFKFLVASISAIWALIFQHSQTEYFGNNWLPQTKEEIMCDVTSVLLMVCAFLLLKSLKIKDNGKD